MVEQLSKNRFRMSSYCVVPTQVSAERVYISKMAAVMVLTSKDIATLVINDKWL